MYIVLACYECMHASDEFPVDLPEKVDQIDSY